MEWEVLQVCGVEFELAISRKVVRCGSVKKGPKLQESEASCFASKIFHPVHFINHAGPHFKSLNLLDTSQLIF